MLQLLRRGSLRWRSIAKLRLDPTTNGAAITPAARLCHLRQRKKPATQTPDDPSLTVSFLENSCSLSSAAALAAAKKIQLRNTVKSEHVLALLEEHGFSKHQISTLVSRWPDLLLKKPDKTLKPKLDFFFSEIGFSHTELFDLLSRSPYLLHFGVERTLRPNLKSLKSIFLVDAKVRDAIAKAPRLLTIKLSLSLLPKLESLKSYGVTEPVIMKLLFLYPCSGMDMVRSFEETLDAIKEMRVKPSLSMFAHAFKVFSIMSKSAWERKLQNFQSLGWSKEQVLRAFRNHPYCMARSEEAIEKRIRFFAEKLKWGPDYVSVYPIILSFSLEKRIVPRCMILGILASKGLLKGRVGARTFMIAEEDFLEKYVMEYEKEVPELAPALGHKMIKLGYFDLRSTGVDWIEHLQKFSEHSPNPTPSSSLMDRQL